MRATEKMAQRCVLVRKLEHLDRDLVRACGEEPSNRVVEEARRLLLIRTGICDKLVAVGYEPWPNPVDVRESKVS